MNNLFDLTGKVAIITGGAGLLGVEHAKAIADAGGIPLLWDIGTGVHEARNKIQFETHNMEMLSSQIDITKATEIQGGLRQLIGRCGRIDILINNAAINSQQGQATPFESFSLEQWNAELNVGLTGAFLCSQIIGGYMAEQGHGVIVNIGSDFSHIAPDPRDYTPNVKPVSYSVVKHGIHGLTRYLAAYWGDKGVRVNTLSMGGVFNGQPAALVDKISAKIPLGRMAQPNEYHGAIQFLCSDASKYMTGQELIIDGGRAIL